MSFRTENKFILPKKKLFEFKHWLNKNSYNILFEKRHINSIYFDSKNFMIYKDSVEGTTPRKKIRIRTYSEFFFDKNNKFNLEIKISSTEGRYKQTKEINDGINTFLIGYNDNQYGICFPVLNVSYQREYFIRDNSRITIDTNIKYSSVNGRVKSNYCYYEDKYVVENKLTNNEKNEMLEFFPFSQTRFSKYCNGVEKVYSEI
tara:strand:+ start:387 stop:995 length:609 start_codon:yes stop_codon:yes gene_type:complete